MLQDRQGKLKLVNSNLFTHVGIALNKSGLHSDVYQIAVLMFKARVTVDKVLERAHSERNCIIFGRVLDTDFLPCYAVINRGRPSQTIIGPNRVYYDPLAANDFRIHVPHEYFGQKFHPIFDEQQPSMVEVYCTPTQNRSIRTATQLLGTTSKVKMGWDVS